MRQAHAGGETKLLYPPMEVWIEPTNFCNLKCENCPHSVGLQRSKGFMEAELFSQLVDEISDYAFTVSLHLGGESLLHKGLPELIEYASSRGLRTVLHTNATLLTRDRCRSLVRSGLSLISFSIDGEDKATYEAMDAGGNYERTLDGVRTFMEEKKIAPGRTPFTVIQMLEGPSDQQRVEAPHTLLALGADYVRLAEFHSWSGEFSHDAKGGAAQKFKELQAVKDEYGPCHNLWYGMAVLWDGSVSPCCMDMEGDYPVGNVKQSSLLSLWNNEPMVNLRKIQVEGRYKESDLCRDCAYLWGKTPGSMAKDARGIVKQTIRERMPQVANAFGVRRWGVRGWNP